MWAYPARRAWVNELLLKRERPDSNRATGRNRSVIAQEENVTSVTYYHHSLQGENETQIAKPKREGASVAEKRRELTCKDIKSFKVDDVVDLWENRSWNGPFIIVKYEFSEATDHSLCSAHVELRKKIPPNEETQVADPMNTEEPEEIELIEKDLPTIRKRVLPEANQKFTVKRVDNFSRKSTS